MAKENGPRYPDKSVATTSQRSKGGQFALHAKVLPGNPYDGHTLAEFIPDIGKFIGNNLERIIADVGYKGHNAVLAHKFKVCTTGQKRNMTPVIKGLTTYRASAEKRHGGILPTLS